MKYFCEYCGEEIPQGKISKNGRNKPPRFCQRDHDYLWRKENGFYERFSHLGLEAQRQVIAETGHAPGYQNRCAALERIRWKGGRPGEKKNSHE